MAWWPVLEIAVIGILVIFALSCVAGPGGLSTPFPAATTTITPPRFTLVTIHSLPGHCSLGSDVGTRGTTWGELGYVGFLSRLEISSGYFPQSP